MHKPRKVLTIADLVAVLSELPQSAVLERADWTYTHKRCRFEGRLEDEDEDEDEHITSSSILDNY